MLTHKEIKNRSLEHTCVKAEYDDGLREVFAFLDELYKAHSQAVITDKEPIQNRDGGKVKVDGLAESEDVEK